MQVGQFFSFQNLVRYVGCSMVLFEQIHLLLFFSIFITIFAVVGERLPDLPRGKGCQTPHTLRGDCDQVCVGLLEPLIIVRREVGSYLGGRESSGYAAIWFILG